MSSRRHHRHRRRVVVVLAARRLRHARRRSRTSAAPARCPARPAGATARAREHPADGRSSAPPAPSRQRGRGAGRGRPPRHRRIEPVPSRRRPSPWVPPDPEALGVSRRQFFNRATVTLMSAGIGAFAAAGFVAFLWPTATGGFGQRSPSASSTTSSTASRSGDGFFYAPAARTWITEYPADALPKAAGGLRPGASSPAWSGLVALYQKCPHLGCRVPVVRHEPVVRVPVPRLAVQPGRREEGRPGARAAWTASRSRSPATATSPSTPARSSPARRSAPTPPARRPRARTASPVRGEH